MAAKKKYKYSTGCAVAHRMLEGKEGGEPRIHVTLRITEGPRTGEELDMFLNLKGGAAEITVKQLRAMGWRCNDITALTGLGSIKVTIAEYKESYEGKLYDRVTVFEMKERAKEVAEGDRKAFAAKFKALALSTKPVDINDANKAPDELPPAREVDADDDFEEAPGAALDNPNPFTV